jgi:peroxiredoxin
MNNSKAFTSDYPATSPAHALEAGKTAPDFCLRTTPDQSVKLSELRGHPVILAFYPADWSPVCGDEMALFNECLPEFQRFDAELMGISVDGVWCHIAFAKDRKLRFPLLSDFEPKGATAAAYGAYRRMEGICERALFVIDRDGVVQWSHVSPIGISPGVDGVLNALEELNNKNPESSNGKGHGDTSADEKPHEDKQDTTAKEHLERHEEAKI